MGGDSLVGTVAAVLADGIVYGDETGDVLGSAGAAGPAGDLTGDGRADFLVGRAART